MEYKYTCYCGLYCENCATKARVEPAAKVLPLEMEKAGFEDIMQYLPEGDAFWRFLSGMAAEGCCASCREGSGDPGCSIRLCAQQKKVELCALCDEYPCPRFDDFFEGYPVLRQDNALLRDQGMDAWGRMQDERRAKGFAYTNEAPEEKT